MKPIGGLQVTTARVYAALYPFATVGAWISDLPFS
jgi:hypothetical protein